MAILSFGATFRGANFGFGLTNTQAYNILVPALGMNIPGGATKFVHLDVFDQYVNSPRHPQAYDVKTNGLVYKDDWTDLCALIQTGKLTVKTTTYVTSSNVFTAGSVATATPSLTGAGSSVYYA